MNIFILRHGQAQINAVNDRSRALTPVGISEVHHVCQASAQHLTHVERMFVSPYRRAIESAEIVEQYIDAAKEECPLITPNGDVNKVIEFIYGVGDRYAHILLVSHQPLVGALVSALSGTEQTYHVMGTANMAYLSCDPVARDCCVLNELHRP